MQDSHKQALLSLAQTHVQDITRKIQSEIYDIQHQVEQIHEKIKAPSSAEGHEKERMRQMFYMMLSQKEDQLEGLKVIEKSPYFVRCDVRFSASNIMTFYFSKYGLQSEGIFSWIVPAATMRFENPGTLSYKAPNGNTIHAELLRKDQFMIVEGKIVYMTSESTEIPRSLVHQEHMPSRKTGFMLPEIVEQMEKAQDAVIRAHAFGSFLISGPAGSGKTTLALHRVAYLMQSPDTAKFFLEKPAIVFVQDYSTKEYFTSLLPQLGITGVKITTFSAWALDILVGTAKEKKPAHTLQNFAVISRYGKSEQIKDLLEYYKSIALVNFEAHIDTKNPLEFLKILYSNVLPVEILEEFENQLEEKLLDRFDLALLLKQKLYFEEKLTKEKLTYGNRKIKGKYQRIVVKEPVEYSLIIVDEVQNYLTDQLKVLKSCINQQTKAMLYVGDLAQQTRLGTLRSWEEIEENFHESRQALLQKVYRNTRQILDYINTLGYQTAIPAGILEGKVVQEVTVESSDEEIQYITQLQQQNPRSTIGVLAKSENRLGRIRDACKAKNLFTLTVHEAQGVEFDIVAIVGFEEFSETISPHSIPDKLLEEKTRVNRDLRYVALTRAIKELHILVSR